MGQDSTTRNRTAGVNPCFRFPGQAILGLPCFRMAVSGWAKSCTTLKSMETIFVGISRGILGGVGFRPSTVGTPSKGWLLLVPSPSHELPCPSQGSPKGPFWVAISRTRVCWPREAMSQALGEKVGHMRRLLEWGVGCWPCVHEINGFPPAVMGRGVEGSRERPKFMDGHSCKGAKSQRPLLIGVVLANRWASLVNGINQSKPVPFMSNQTNLKRTPGRVGCLTPTHRR